MKEVICKVELGGGICVREFYSPVQALVRCKDCVHRGNAEKCVLAAIAAEKDYPLFMLDNRGEWYCADGKIQEGR